MDGMLFHPRIVHVPLALGILMPFLSAGILLAWWTGWLPARAWLLAVVMQAILVGSGFLAMQSGEEEEEPVERIVAERFIEHHEEAAESFVWSGAAVLLVMALGLVFSRRRRTGQLLAALGTVSTLAVAAQAYRTGEAGGALVYRHGAAGAYVDRAAGSSSPAHHDDD